MKKKWISWTVDILLVAIIALLGYVWVSMLVTKNKNYGVPEVFGQSILYVATDSMEDPDNPNCLAPGTGIIISRVNPADIAVSNPILDEHGQETGDYDKKGDIVTFYYTNIKAPDTHRVVKKVFNEEEQKYYFTTMGDNPTAHQYHRTETWSQDYLIGKVTYASRALGSFLEISSPDAAAYLSARTGEDHKAWFFPVAILTPMIAIAASSLISVFIKQHKEKKAREAEIEAALVASGIDLNDLEACELFRTKEEIRLDIKEEMEKEYKKIKEQARKELEKKKKEEENNEED